MKGIVKWFNKKSGFGFIESPDYNQDLFAHFSEINMDGFKFLKNGWTVSFEIGQGPIGDVAKNIKILTQDNTKYSDDQKNYNNKTS